MTTIWKSCRTSDLIGSVLAVFVAITNELHVDAVIAVAAELIDETLAVRCATVINTNVDRHFYFQLLINQHFRNYSSFSRWESPGFTAAEILQAGCPLCQPNKNFKARKGQLLY